MNARERILGRLPRQEPMPPEPYAYAKFEVSRESFEAAFVAAGGKVATWGEVKALGPAFVERKASSHTPALIARGEDPWSAEIGITLVEAAVVETGSLVVAYGADSSRLASLAPSVHVALIRPDQIVGRLADGFEVLRNSGGVLITGPSRTADIEGVLVRPAHGPRELWMIWLE